MSITDELRHFANEWDWLDYRADESARRLRAIADRIDAEHESACAEAYGNGVMSVPIALDESAWVKLPVDADGVPIHIGDVMEWPDTSTAEVVGVYESGFFYVDSEDDIAAEWTTAYNKVHHAPKTVEDVLREFADEVYADADNEIRDRDFLCAKYAKRLTNNRRDCTVWARGSLLSPDFTWCHVRRGEDA